MAKYLRCWAFDRAVDRLGGEVDLSVTSDLYKEHGPDRGGPLSDYSPESLTELLSGIEKIKDCDSLAKIKIFKLNGHKFHHAHIRVLDILFQSLPLFRPTEIWMYGTKKDVLDKFRTTIAKYYPTSPEIKSNVILARATTGPTLGNRSRGFLAAAKGVAAAQGVNNLEPGKLAAKANLFRPQAPSRSNRVKNLEAQNLAVRANLFKRPAPRTVNVVETNKGRWGCCTGGICRVPCLPSFQAKTPVNKAANWQGGRRTRNRRNRRRNTRKN